MIKEMQGPKIDLHLHLDGSLSVDIIRKLAKIQNMELDLSDEELKEKLQVQEGCKSLNEYLTKFDFPLMFLQTEEGIEEGVYFLLEELLLEGMDYVEVRFAPQLHQQKGLTQMQVVESAVRGLERSKLSASLILCCMRGNKNHEENLETIRIASGYQHVSQKDYYTSGYQQASQKEKEHLSVCAVDLAGAEALYPTENFEEEFLLARELGVPFTIHAGEAAGSESVWKALSFGAKRIGHGVRAQEDKELMKELARRGTVLELCPTSNLQTAIYSDIKEYPIREFLEAGIRVTINTDNRMVSNTTLEKEYTLLQEAFSLTEEELNKIKENAVYGKFTA